MSQLHSTTTSHKKGKHGSEDATGVSEWIYAVITQSCSSCVCYF